MVFNRQRNYFRKLPSNRTMLNCGSAMPRKIAAIAAWAILCFLAYATISPITARPTLHIAVSLERMAAFASVGFLFYFAYPHRLGLVLVLVFGSAALLELMQIATVDRHARLADLIEKMVGGSIGLAAGRAILRYEPALRDWVQPIATARRWRSPAASTLIQDSLSRGPDIQRPSRQPERLG